MTKQKIESLMSIYQPLEQQTADKTASTESNNPNTYTGNLYNDHLFFKWNFVDPMEYSYMYQQYANDVVKNANENLSFFESLGNDYEYKKNSIILDRFQGRSIDSFSYTEMFQYYIHYDFSAFLVILICLYALMSVFVTEKETEMDVLLLTTKAGGQKTIFAKLFSASIFVCAVSFWFGLIDFIAFASSFGSLEAKFSPIYAIENFADTALNISLGEYALISLMVKTIGFLIVSYLFLFVSLFFKNALLPFIISLFFAFGLIYFQEAYMGSERIILKVINPFSLVVHRMLFSGTEFVNIFGFPMLSYTAAICFGIICGGIFLLAIFIFQRKNTIYRIGVKQRGDMVV
ncbi:ABC transporter permease [Pseudogracilibacillus sp. SO30301A]|uniref:ABC transporter permease n=1 Tax=Pseudogracilibacillus sp. SO30301A TaxID=3098291 RepID=UPI00300E634C